MIFTTRKNEPLARELVSVEIHESSKHVSDSNYISVHRCVIGISRREGISRGMLDVKVKWKNKSDRAP